MSSRRSVFPKKYVLWKLSHYGFDHVSIMAKLNSYTTMLLSLAPPSAHQKHVIPSLTISSPGARQAKEKDEEQQE
jgi:hypothetical protein